MASSSDRDKDQKDAQSQPDNPFIRFRQFADAQIGSLLQGIIGLPSAFTKNPSGNARWADFDEELRRRDELQARQKELRESEARRKQDEELEIPVKKSAKQENSFASREEYPTNYRSKDEKVETDIPLYSPVTKALFAHLLPVDSGPDWNQFKRITSPRDALRMEYFPFRLMQDQIPSSNMEALQFMAYNELNGSSTFRSDYSLLPYILFSPYSPIKLHMEASKPRRPAAAGFAESSTSLPTPLMDDFPYHIAFEDLIRTTQGSTMPLFPRSIRAFHPFNQVSQDVGAHNSVAWMAWIHDLYGENLLQQQEIRELPRLIDMLPASPFPKQKANNKDEKASQDAETEQDMYDRFLRWASTPSAIAGALDSLCTDTEGFIEKQLRALESPDSKRTIKELMESKFAKEVMDMVEMLERFDRVNAQSISSQIREKLTQDTHSKSPQDQDKVVSTSTTTEHTTHEDGSVETCVTVWKRYADGRESVTTTNHCEDPAFDDDDKAIPCRRPQIAEENLEKTEKKVQKKGWFWN
jgi:hypothetical protein